MDRHTGRAIGGDAHLAQSVLDILTTPRGSLVMQREYGSDLPALLDQPINGSTIVDLYQATAEAIDRWEPRLDLARIRVADAKSTGRLDIELIDGDGNVIVLPLGARSLEAGA
ncbi:MAG: GPW/gp25 family protein [Shimia sp.]